MTGLLLAAGLVALAVGLLAGGGETGGRAPAALVRVGRGTSGVAGPLVPSGRSGLSGARGHSGPSGVPGVPGVRGVPGAPGASARGLPRWLAHPAAPAGAAGGAALLLAGPVAGLLATVAALVGRAAWRDRARSTAERRDHQRAVEAVEALAAELRAGRPAVQALGAAAEVATGQVGTALRRAAQAAALGGDVPAALLSTGGRPLLSSLAACWRVCAGTGSGLAAAVERLAEGLAADADQRRVLEAELAGPRATAGLLAVLPVAGVALAAGLGADPLQVLLHTRAGAVCLVAGVALDLLGLLWTRALVRRALTA